MVKRRKNRENKGIKRLLLGRQKKGKLKEKGKKRANFGKKVTNKGKAEKCEI